MLVSTIFHAHNWTFARIRESLPGLARGGFDAVQMSPAQKSPPGDAWYMRYQPFDYLVIEGLGDEDELKALCREAQALGVTIIADVVFNHMAVPVGARRADWVAADAQLQTGDHWAMEELYAKLSWFPHLSRDDFQPWHDMQGAEWDNEHRYDSWGNGEWPELKPTANVLALHKQHLELLYSCGVRGFRIDAVKHMRVPHLAVYVDSIIAFAEPCWIYGEVFASDESMHREYDHLFPTTDFPFILKLKAALKDADSVIVDHAHAFLSPTSIRFGHNHDLACNPAHLVAGFLFERPEHTRLANALAALASGGTTLVFADDYEQDDLLRRCVAFRARTGGVKGPIVLPTRDALDHIALIVHARKAGT